MKIAIIAYNHPESSLPLANYLCEFGNHVDYYFITRKNTVSTSSFNFQLAPKTLGIVNLTKENIPEIYQLWENTKVNFNLLRIFFLPFRTLPFINRFLQKITIKKSLQQINGQDYDIINFVGQAPFLKYLNKKTFAKAKIHSLHEVLPHYSKQRISRKFINYLLKNRIPIIVHSKTSFDALKTYKASKRHNNAHCIPFGLFETYNTIKSANNLKDLNDFLLFYGRIKPYKGLSLLYDAMKVLETRGIEIPIVIAGAGIDNSLEKFAKLSNCYIFNTHLSNEELVEMNLKAKAIVCPYSSASQSGIVQTSFLFGKPVIATTVGAFPEIIFNNENGLLINNNSSLELANAIEKIFTDNEFYENLTNGVNQFTHKQKEFHWNSISKKTNDLFLKLYHNEV